MRVLIVGDAKDSADWICQTLDAAGFDARRATTQAALADLQQAVPAAILLDLSVPDPAVHDGFRIIEAARARGLQVPVVILSALGHADERVRGRRAGADAFLTKPLAAAELVARLRELIHGPVDACARPLLRCGDLTMDLDRRRVERGGRLIELKPGEFRLLEQLLRNKDQVITQGMLLEAAWDYRFDPHASLVDTHVARLRRKIDDGFGRPLLHTRRGVGYKLSETP